MLIKGFFFHLFLNAASITGLLYAKRVLKMLQMDHEYLRNVEVCESFLLCLKWLLRLEAFDSYWLGSMVYTRKKKFCCIWYKLYFAMFGTTFLQYSFAHSKYRSHRCSFYQLRALLNYTWVTCHGDELPFYCCHSTLRC